MKVPELKVGQVWYDVMFNEIVEIIALCPDISCAECLSLKDNVSVDTKFKFFQEGMYLQFSFICDHMTDKKLLELRIKYGF